LVEQPARRALPGGVEVAGLFLLGIFQFQPVGLGLFLRGGLAEQVRLGGLSPPPSALAGCRRGTFPVGLPLCQQFCRHFDYLLHILRLQLRQTGGCFGFYVFRVLVGVHHIKRTWEMSQSSIGDLFAIV